MLVYQRVSDSVQYESWEPTWIPKTWNGFGAIAWKAAKASGFYGLFREKLLQL